MKQPPHHNPQALEFWAEAKKRELDLKLTLIVARTDSLFQIMEDTFVHKTMPVNNGLMDFIKRQKIVLAQFYVHADNESFMLLFKEVKKSMIYVRNIFNK